MDLLLLGLGMGVVGGWMPSPLHLIALAQIGLGRWARAFGVLVGLPLLVDGALLLMTIFFYRYIPGGIAHDLAYVGGAILIFFGVYALAQSRKKSHEELANSAPLTYASISVAIGAELSAPGTWLFWLTVAGPIIGEGRVKGLWHPVPFFIGSLIGYYGAAIFSVWLMAWGAGLYKRFNQRLFLIANLLLLILGVSYLLRAYFGK